MFLLTESSFGLNMIFFILIRIAAKATVMVTMQMESSSNIRMLLHMLLGYLTLNPEGKNDL